MDIEDLKSNTEYHKYQPTSLQVSSSKPYAVSCYAHFSKHILLSFACIFRSSGSGELWGLWTMRIGPSSCNSLLVHLRFPCKGLGLWRVWMVFRNSRSIVMTVLQIVYLLHTHGNFHSSFLLKVNLFLMNEAIFNSVFSVLQLQPVGFACLWDIR